MTTAALPTRSVADLRAAVAERLAGGARFVGLFCSATNGAAPDAPVRLTTVLDGDDGWELADANVEQRYDAFTSLTPAAGWYERAAHDLFGVSPQGHPRLDPLVLPRPTDAEGRPARLPRPGAGGRRPRTWPSEDAVPRHVVGEGLFTIPHGPVRGGATESLEFLVETPGEDIPKLQVRVFAKHRGIETAFEGRPPADGVVIAERVEGTASVAHAMAYCQAVERLGHVEITEPAGLLRLVHAELERIAGHLEVATRLCEGAALAVGVARFGHHKESAQRIRHDLCGSRFGRGVVLPGGVVAPLGEHPEHELALRVAGLRDVVLKDRDALMVTASFLDRLLTTGILASERAAEMAAVGPVGRASGVGVDVRRATPYGGYRDVEMPAPSVEPRGDCQARLEIRWEEVEKSFSLVGAALSRLSSSRSREWLVPVPVVDGRAHGVVEGPQGETGYVVTVANGRLRRVWPRTASFHNLPLFHDVFHGDVLTDFTFIEASFAVSNAGVVM